MTEAHEDYAAAQAAEYGQYRAVVPIHIGNARAFNVGDAVPASHVTSGVVSQDQVERVATKAAAVKKEN
jgi:hypothetical protein